MQSQNTKKRHDWYYGKLILIPNEWEIEDLGEVSDDIYRYPTYYGIKYLDHGIPEIRGELLKENGTLQPNKSAYRYISPETSNQFPRTIVKEGDIVFSVRGTMGKLALIPKEMDGANITANLIRIAPNKKKVHPSYLKYYLLCPLFRNRLDALSPQTTIKTIESTELKSIKVIIPLLLEQEKIASILCKVDELIQKTDKIIEQTQRLKKSLMQRLLTKGIGHTKFREVRFGGQVTECIPESWLISTIEEISINGSQNGVAISANDYGKGVPIVTMTDLFAGDVLVPSNLPEVHILTDIERFALRDGDLLFGRRSLSVEGAGKCVLVPKISDKIIFESSIIRVTLDNGKVESRFIHYLLNSPIGKRIMTRIVQVVAVSGVTGSDIRKLRISYPKSIHEQKKISIILANIDSCINYETELKSALMALKKGLMQKLLTGRIRVKV